MTAKENPKLILRFKLAGENDPHVCSATRIAVDGHGGLTLYDGSTPQRIDLTELQSLSICSLGCAGRAA
jgi:hypothetical protein